MNKIDENTQFKINIKSIIAICFGILSIAGVYFTLIAKIQQMNINLMRMSTEQQMNSEFRVKWPRGEMGSLPDDAEQNLRLIYIEKHQSKIMADLDNLKLNVKELQGCIK